MFDSKPGYIDLYNAERIAIIAFSIFVFLSGCVDFTLFTIYNSSSYHAATTSEIIDYVAVILLSGLSQVLAAFFVWKGRDLLAESIGPFIPIILIGGVIFWVSFFLYIIFVGLDGS